MNTECFFPVHQYTPLYEAARSDNVDTVRYLVENGAGIDIKDGYLGVSDYLRLHINLDIVDVSV